MIVLLGSTGYIGEAFARALSKRGAEFVAPLRRELDYTRFGLLRAFLQEKKPQFLINAAGHSGKPNVDACELDWAGTLQGNTLFATMVAHACEATGVPFGHVSSGCIYNGAKVIGPGGVRIEKDLTSPEMRLLLKKNPRSIAGFSEADEPNFTFRNGPCSFYSGTKALAEEAVAAVGQNYLWRLRIPFDQFDNPRNFLSKVQNYRKVYVNVNSISHRGDFVEACLGLWEKRAPFGIYNVTNPGFVSTSQVVEWIQRILKPQRSFEFWADDEEFYRLAARAPRSNCILDTSKLIAAGVGMRPVEEALEEALRNWTKEPEA